MITLTPHEIREFTRYRITLPSNSKLVDAIDLALSIGTIHVDLFDDIIEPYRDWLVFNTPVGEIWL